MERDGSRLRLCFSFNGLAGCVQGPGVNLFSGCSRLGSDVSWKERQTGCLDDDKKDLGEITDAGRSPTTQGFVGPGECRGEALKG